VETFEEVKNDALDQHALEGVADDLRMTLEDFMGDVVNKIGGYSR
jgi:hypothetical protein